MDHLSLASVRSICKKLHLVCRRSRADTVAAIRTLAGLSPYYKDLVATYVRQEEWKGSDWRASSPHSPLRKATLAGLKVMCEDRGISPRGLTREQMIRRLARPY